MQDPSFCWRPFVPASLLEGERGGTRCGWQGVGTRRDSCGKGQRLGGGAGGRQTRATEALAAGLMKEEETGWQVQVLERFQEMSLRKGEQSDKYSKTSGTLNTNSRFVICQRAFN